MGGLRRWVVPTLSLAGAAFTVLMGAAVAGPSIVTLWRPLGWVLVGVLLVLVVAPSAVAARRLRSWHALRGRPKKARALFPPLLCAWTALTSSVLLAAFPPWKPDAPNPRWLVTYARSLPLGTVGSGGGGGGGGGVRLRLQSRLDDGQGGTFHRADYALALTSGYAKLTPNGELHVTLTTERLGSCGDSLTTEREGEGSLTAKIGPGGVRGALGHTVAAPGFLHVAPAGHGELEPGGFSITLQPFAFEAGARVRGNVALHVSQAKRWADGTLDAEGAFDIPLCGDPDPVVGGGAFRPPQPGAGAVEGTLDGDRTRVGVQTVVARRRRGVRDAFDTVDLGFFDAPTTCSAVLRGEGPRARFWVIPALPASLTHAIGIPVAARLDRTGEKADATVTLTRAEVGKDGGFAGTMSAWRPGGEISVAGTFSAELCDEPSARPQ